MYPYVIGVLSNMRKSERVHKNILVSYINSFYVATVKYMRKEIYLAPFLDMECANSVMLVLERVPDVYVYTYSPCPTHRNTLHHSLVNHIMAGACATGRGNMVRQEVREGCGGARLVLYSNHL